MNWMALSSFCARCDEVEMNKLLIVILIVAALLFPLTAAAFSLFSGTVPTAAKNIASDLDAQLMKRYADCDPKSRRPVAYRDHGYDTC